MNKQIAILVYCIVLSNVLTQEIENESNSDEVQDAAVRALIKEPDVELGLSPMETEMDEGNIKLFSIQWDDHHKTYRKIFTFSAFFIFAALIKILYHHSLFLTTTIPDSCILILTGLAFGAALRILHPKNADEFSGFEVETFFYYLLPPIILESAYSLHNPSFFSNLITILMYAIVGTLINVLFIGVSLYICIRFEFLDLREIPLIELMIYATALSAVDPVCVLTIFQDLSVNKSLYFLVFGESLFNDAVVIVLHRVMSAFVMAAIITAEEILLGFTYFFLISLGGLTIGMLFGILTAFMTLYTTHVRVVEPMIMFGMAYLSFLSAELIRWSGLISMIGCGLVQAEYAFSNISQKSSTTVKYATKTLSSISELIIFFILGAQLINKEPDWNSAFVLLSILFCLIFRVVSVFSLTYISNNYFQRTRKINFEEQALMAYGGLRGAVSFAVIAIIEEEKKVNNIQLFRTTTLVIILFTVFILGGTTKPLMNLLRIQRESDEKGKLFITVNNKVYETIALGIEEIVGNLSLTYYIKHYISVLIEVLRKLLTHGKQVEKIESTFQKIQMHSEKEKIFGPENKSESKSIQSHEPKKSIRESTELQAISEIIDSNPTDFHLYFQLIENPIIIEKIERIRTIPKEMGLKVKNALKTFKESGRRVIKFDRSDSQTQTLKLRFENIKYVRPEVDVKEKMTRNEHKDSMKPLPRKRTTDRRTKEDFDSERHDMTKTFTEAFRLNLFEEPHKETEVRRRPTIR